MAPAAVNSAPSQNGTSASENHAKVALVTGGASGIGRAMAGYFVDQAYGHVVILDVDAVAGERIAAELQAAAASPKATKVRFLRCDVSKWEDQAAAFADVFSVCGGRIDAVMANAGISEGGSSSMVTAAVEEPEAAPSKPSLRTLDVNLAGVIYKSRTTGRRGSIICTASNAGIYSFPVAPLYAASKFAVIGLVRSLQVPLERASIQINALAPAVLDMILTPMSTLVKGIDQILADPSISGGVAEIHGDRVTFRASPEFVDQDSKKNLDNFWNLGYA